MKFTTTYITTIAALLANGSVTKAVVINGQSETMAAAAEGGFASSCKDFAITRREFSTGTYFDIEAKCATISDGELNTRLQLGLCLSNDAGVLKWSKRGNFDKSCESCTIRNVSKKEVKMRCWCHPAYGETVRLAEINLNDGIRNEGGHTWCGDEIGTAW
ncbi:uncharacterized protein ColSpa_03802 [Colletotrichum spaethianum]|uniref:Cyanovirin-N domain-containing protein n=1 Tax=Colletotrichum spaethianum TaxID=700344 RepID=A0AA37L881_9PEZI|nr:uncharacterized protein ColSpa_03802 [Colletotrichum spaethianum]GKT43621.1 hypothetical protein ColSpa_03802 [Colletotrichum spaethianum]